MRLRPLASAVLLSCTIGSAAVCADEDPLSYQERGNRHEGIRARPVSGARLVLVSVVPRGEHGDVAPEDGQLRFEFFVASGTAEPRPMLREGMPATYYWLDRVKLAPLEIGRVNLFSWPADVVQKIHVPPRSLHVLIPDGGSERDAVSMVIPAVFDQPYPEKVERYEFTFRSNDDAALKFEVFDPSGTSLPCDPPKREVFAGELTQVAWRALSQHDDPAQALPAGEYRMWVSGISYEDNSAIDRVIQFYHEPRPQR